METLYKIQPTEIEQLMQEKLADRKIDDEFGWTGEWRMSPKNVLDLIIDLNASRQIEKLEAEKKELLEALEETQNKIVIFKANAHQSAINLYKQSMETSAHCSEAMATAYGFCIHEIESLIQKHKQ